MRGLKRRMRNLATVGAFLSLVGTTLGQTDLPGAFARTTCSSYVSGQSWTMLACGQSSGLTSLVGYDSGSGTVKELATVSDYTSMGKKAIESFSVPIYITDTTTSKTILGTGTFDSYVAVLKVQNQCGETGFVAGVVINAQLATNEAVGGEIYFAPLSYHSDESSAEKAAAAISADDPGETGDYPPNMSPNLTQPTQQGPNVYPPKYIPGPNAPADADEQARICWDNYRASCRTAFTTYKNTLANLRNNTFNGAGTGATVGTAAGAAIGLYTVAWVCVFFGPPGWAVAGGAVAIGAAIGGAGGIVAGPAITYEEGKQTAIQVLKNDTDSALAAYIKCLEGYGYVRNPLYR